MSDFAGDLLEGLTEPQTRAVQHVDGPLLVLAGPGSGKTTVVTRRVAWLVTLGSLALGCGQGAEPAGGSSEPATLAPDFSLQALSGQSVTLSEFQGKTVIVDFWATWCPPCVFQVPELNKLQVAHAAAGDLVVIGVAVDVEGEEVVRPWAEEHSIEYIVALGHERLASKFGAMANRGAMLAVLSCKVPVRAQLSSP